ncbi:hypothetical protein GUH51_17030, partial [Xanthomonas citri pv. citri]|nr:hypothetical protein [Xanthomonas citri pv. citri]
MDRAGAEARIRLASGKQSRQKAERVASMLHDRDRIFRNIYGFHDVGLKGA